MRRALEYATGLGVTLAQHCEDATLAADGAMHEGAWSSRLGVPGMPAVAEEVMVARDIALARATGGRVHFLHLSTAGSVEPGAPGQGRGPAGHGRGGAPPLHPHRRLQLAGYDPVFKVNPPLRPSLGRRRGEGRAGRRHHRRHRHRPRPPPPRAQGPPLRPGPAGHAGPADGAVPGPRASSDLPLARILALMSWQPAAIAGLDPDHGGDQGGPVAPGAAANLCVIDPDGHAGRSTRPPWPAAAGTRPTAGRTLTGRVRHTVFRGEPVVIDAEAQR